MTEKWVVSLFDRTGNIAKPWVEDGYRAMCVDIRHKGSVIIDGIDYVEADVLKWVPPRSIVNDVVFFAAFPPCTHLAVSGARWFRGKGLGALAESIQLFERAAFWAEWFGAPYFIENPVSTISTYWRKPDYTFHPWHFSRWCEDDTYNKTTCLWTGGGFVMPDKAILPDIEPDDRIFRLPPSDDRADLRSATPMGLSRAVKDANCPRLAA